MSTRTISPRTTSSYRITPSLRRLISAGVAAALVGTALVAGGASGAQAEPRTFVVEQGGASGTYATIQLALDAANQPGDAVVIAPGTYVESPTAASAGSVDAPITITAQSSGVVIKGSLTIAAADISVSNLALDGTLDSTQGSGVIAASAVKVTAKRAQVTGMRLTNFEGWGIEFALGSPGQRQRASDGYAANNTMYNVSGGFHLVDNTVVEGNTIEHLNTFGNTAMPGDGFRVFGSHVVIRGNVVKGSQAVDIQPVHADIIQSWDDLAIPVSDVLVENNVFTGWYNQGVLLENDAFGPTDTYYISDWTIRNNVFDGFESWGVLAGKPGGGIPNMRVENNVFHGDIANNTGFYGVVFTGTGGTGTVKNNMLVQLTQSSYSATDGATFSAGGNLIYRAPQAAAPVTTDVFGYDPLFVDEAALDFHLTNRSPALDAGVSVDFATDAEGRNRVIGSAVDIGPFEYDGPPAPTTPDDTIPRVAPGPDMVRVTETSGANKMVYGVETYCVNDRVYLGVLIKVTETVKTAVALESSYASTKSIYYQPQVENYVTFDLGGSTTPAFTVGLRGYRSTAGTIYRSIYTASAAALTCNLRADTWRSSERCGSDRRASDRRGSDRRRSPGVRRTSCRGSARAGWPRSSASRSSTARLRTRGPGRVRPGPHRRSRPPCRR